jgi:alanine racemase
LKRDSFLGIVPVGYGDGYPISLSNKAVVQLCGKGGSGSAGSGSGSSDKSTPRYAPVIGRVNMDQIIVDLTHPTAPANHSACQIAQAQVDDVVELVGSEADAPNSLVNLAAHAGSTCYEMLCRVSHRVPRVWHDSAQSADPIALPFRDHSAA